MPGLFDPITIKGLTLKNRIVMPPMATNSATEDGEITDKSIEHYAARARSGVALIIIEHTYVSREGRLSAKQTGIYDDRLIPGLKRLADAIHAEGAKTVIQITHGGSRTNRNLTGEQPAGPSNIALPNAAEAPRQFSPDELGELAAKFGNAARRAMEAGFDSVELHGAHGFLLGQFLSPYSNNRKDEYGGSPEKRLAFPVKVIAEVRKHLGKDVPLFYRFGADDLIEGGMTADEGKTAAQGLAAAGVDVIDVSGGIGGDGQRTLTEQGYFVPLARGVRESAKVPVIGVGKITEAEYADKVVREGQIDLVAIGRALLSNPKWPGEAAERLGVKL